MKKDSYHLYTVKELLELQDDGNRWIVPHMIPRVGRTFVYGKGGEYKSAIIFDLCVAVASAGKMLEQFAINTYGPVILMSVESSIYENRTRLLAHMRARNLNPQDVMLRYGQRRLKLDTKEGMDDLEQIIIETQPVFLALDPYIAFFSGNENNASEVNKFTDCLDYLIEKYEISIAVIHHANKNGDIRGSSSIQGWCDSVIRFTSDRDVKIPNVRFPVRVIHVFGEKQRNGREGMLFSAVPMHDEQTGLITFGIYADAEGANVVVAMLKQEIYRILREAGRVLTQTDLVAQTGCAADKVQAAIEWLARCKLIARGFTSRKTSTDGKRARAVSGWEAPYGYSRVDVARAMLWAQVNSGDTEDASQ